MRELLPEGEELTRATKWVSAQLQENPDQPLQLLIQQAIFKFDLSPKEAESLIFLYKTRER